MRRILGLYKEWNFFAPENILSYLEQGGSEIVYQERFRNDYV